MSQRTKTVVPIAVASIATPKANKVPRTTRSKKKDQPFCDLCTNQIDSSEDLVKCEGSCQQPMHRYCAGVTKAQYAELSTSSTPFKCWLCSHKAQEAAVSYMRDSIEEVKLKLTLMQSSLDGLSAGQHSECPCRVTVSAIQNEVQELSQQCASYADIVKKTEIMPRKGPERRGRKVPSGNNASNPIRPPKRKKVVVQGSRKIWGTLRKTNVDAIINSLKAIPCIKSQLCDLTVKRKFKSATTNNSKNKWWYIVRGEEQLMKDLDENWKPVYNETGWLLEPVLRYDESSESATNPEQEVNPLDVSLTSTPEANSDLNQSANLTLVSKESTQQAQSTSPKSAPELTSPCAQQDNAGPHFL